MELDRDRLEAIAAEALRNPYSNDLHASHGAMFSWWPYGDDLVDESNYHVALDLIRAKADEGRDDTDVSDEHVIAGGSAIYVQVYMTGEKSCEWDWCEDDAEHIAMFDGETRGNYCDFHLDDARDELIQRDLTIVLRENPWIDEDDQDLFYRRSLEKFSADAMERAFTPAFVEAAMLQDSLVDYPLLNDSDYCEREYERFQESVLQAVADAQCEYDADTSEEGETIVRLASNDLGELLGSEANGNVLYSRVERIYAEARDTYFDALAREIYRWHVLGYNPNQLELFAV
ncbi:hypothetical protein [Streptodolium elevatio]|uniref:Uncharacterized protein n=1 Tax=Streptodolium elevatio TaxID=3157996 RepID=A0ABV3DBX3_9ACTN